MALEPLRIEWQLLAGSAPQAKHHCVPRRVLLSRVLQLWGQHVGQQLSRLQPGPVLSGCFSLSADFGTPSPRKVPSPLPRSCQCRLGWRPLNPVAAACFTQPDSSIEVGCSLNSFIRPSSRNRFAYRVPLTHVVKIVTIIKKIGGAFGFFPLPVLFTRAVGGRVKDTGPSQQ